MRWSKDHQLLDANQQSQPACVGIDVVKSNVDQEGSIQKEALALIG